MPTKDEPEAKTSAKAKVDAEAEAEAEPVKDAKEDGGYVLVQVRANTEAAIAFLEKHGVEEPNPRKRYKVKAKASAVAKLKAEAPWCLGSYAPVKL